MGAYSPSGAPTAPSESGRGFAVAGLVLAIVSLLALLPAVAVPAVAGLGSLLFLIVGLVSSVIGIGLSALGLHSPSGKMMAIVGLVLSIVGLVLWILILGAIVR